MTSSSSTRGRVRKRRKGPSKPFRQPFGHTPVSLAEDIPWRCGRLVVGSGIDGALPVMHEVTEARRSRPSGDSLRLVSQTTRPTEPSMRTGPIAGQLRSDQCLKAESDRARSQRDCTTPPKTRPIMGPRVDRACIVLRLTDLAHSRTRLPAKVATSSEASRCFGPIPPPRECPHHAPRSRADTVPCCPEPSTSTSAGTRCSFA